ncbi:seven transmembrane protein 1 [Aplysia californica]|uniref:Seven transmembrane protein 1 n=1 Tax=Aplysia californica TaxID=6500 RepID=A0ABM0JTJ4_APLCA|nr:seven transmembrane protein 1 [Aplysia californica]XP_035826360.1 seven transmembrane protein 1 [Aplysia californica]
MFVSLYPVYTKQYFDDPCLPFNATNVTKCEDGVQWVWKVIGDCVVTPREQASAYLGLISMLTWMMVGIPQIIKNARNLEGLAGVSFFLLFQWTGGDTTNLIGSILTNQLKFQVYLAVYFVLSDVVLLMQYLMFYVRKRRRQERERREQLSIQGPQLILCFMGLFALSHTVLSLAWTSPDAALSHRATSGRLSRSLLSIEPDSQDVLVFSPEDNMEEISRGVLGQDGNVLSRQVPVDAMAAVHKGKNCSLGTGSANFWHDTTDIIGYVIGVISSIFYLGSRTAQIIKNVQKQSTEGLAVFTFALAVLGNLTYGGQILVRDLSLEFILEHFPWLVGSLGVIGLDVTLLAQFRYYSSRNRNNDEMRKALLTKDYIIKADEVAPVEVPPVEVPQPTDLRFSGDIL